MKVRLLDLSGKILIQQDGDGQQDWALPLENLPNGFYLLEIQTGTERTRINLAISR